MKRWNSGKIPMVIIIVLAVVILGGVGVLAMKSKSGKHGVQAEKLPTTSVALGEFVVNLADTDQIRYLKASIALDVTGPVPKSGEGGESGPDPKIRDAVIGVLSSKRFADMVAPNGKEVLKKDILVAVNKRLEEGQQGCRCLL